MDEAPFQVGDILIKKSIHALMWVGGAQCIAHNSLEKQGAGVVRMAAGGYFGKIQSWEKYPLNVAVYRLAPARTEVAERAAKHAMNWSTEFDISLASTNVSEVVFKSPLDGKRLLAAEQNGTQPFKTESLLRALKAIARGETGLSPRHGTACSSFVTYCYQSAFLETFVGATIVGDVEKILKLHEGRLGKITKLFNQTENLREDALDLLLSKAKTTLPKAVLKDAKTMHIEEFEQGLEEPDSGFKLVGYAAYHNGEIKMITCAKNEEKSVTWSRIVMEIFDDLT